MAVPKNKTRLIIFRTKSIAGDRGAPLYDDYWNQKIYIVML